MTYLERERLAWAAGFFEGEGSCCINQERPGQKRFSPRLTIQQMSPEVLVWFQQCVGGLGVVTGPHSRNRNREKQFWQFNARGWREVQAIVAMLWGFLGEVKKNQIKETYREVSRRIAA